MSEPAKKKHKSEPASEAKASTAAANKVSVPCRAGDPRYDTPENKDITTLVSPEDAEYKLDPLHFGPKVIFLNAQDPAFYSRIIPDPKLKLWILTRKDTHTSYVSKRLWEQCWKRKIHVEFKVTNNFELVTATGTETLLYGGTPVEPPDAVLPRVGAGVDYFGLSVIRQIEKLGVVILNGWESINMSRDKLHTLQHVSAHGIPTPKTLVAKFPIDTALIEREFTFPVILKKSSGSQGKGVMKLDSAEQLEDIVDMLEQKDPLIFQEFLQHSAGRDLRVFVVGGRVIASMMRTATTGFKANVHQGGTVKGVSLLGAVEWLSLETVKLIGLDVAGVDLLIDKNTYKICEVNSSPGFEGLERATGVDVAGQMLEYVKFRLGVWRIGGRHKTILMEDAVVVDPAHR